MQEEDIAVYVGLDNTHRIVFWAYADENISYDKYLTLLRTIGGSKAMMVTNSSGKYTEEISKQKEAGQRNDVFLDIILVDRTDGLMITNSELHDTAWASYVTNLERNTLSGPKKIVNNRSDQRVLFQPDPEHEAEVKKAVEVGRPVPDNVLQSYSDRDWAQAEIERRDKKELQDETLSWLEDEARDFKTAGEFVAYAQSMLEIDEKLGQNDPEWFEAFWRRATKYDESREWKDQWDRQSIISLLEQVGSLRKEATDARFHGTIISAAIRMQSGKEITDKLFGTIQKILTNNPELYRLKIAELNNDPEEMRSAWEAWQDKEEKDRLNAEAKEKLPTRRERIKVAKDLEKYKNLSKKIESGEILLSEIDELGEDVTKEIIASDRKLKKLQDELLEGDRKRDRMIDSHMETVSELEFEKKRSSRLEKKLDTKDRNIEKLKNREKEKRVKTKINKSIDTVLNEKKIKEIRAAHRERMGVLRDRVLKEKAKRTALKRKQKAIKDLREQKKNLARSIIRPVAKNVDIEYREQIQALQGQLDPDFRSPKTVNTWNKRKEHFLKHPEEIDNLSTDVKMKRASTSLSELSLEDLKELADQIDHLRSVGETKRRLKAIIGTKEIQDIISSAVKTLIGNKPLNPPREPIVGDPHTPGDKIKALYWSTMRPSRLVDALDGKADFSGVLHKTFIDDVNEAVSKEITNRNARVKKLNTKMKSLSIELKDFTRKITVEPTGKGSSFTVTMDQVLKVYVNTKNERNLARMVAQNGNNVDLNLANLLISKLSKNELAFAKAIIDDYDENFNRLDEAHIELTNERLVRESGWYSPMDVLTRDYSGPKGLEKEMSQQHGITRGTVNRSMTKSRIDISPKHQTPMKIDGLYSEWLMHSYKQEHYIEMAKTVHKMRRVLANKDFQAAVRNHKGGVYLTELNSYVSRVANPNVMWSNDPASRLVRAAKKNFALAALAYNTVTMFKQLPSVVFYTADSSPGEMLSALGEVGKNWKKWRQFVEERDPLMMERSTEREIEALRRNRDMQIQNTVKKVQWAGMQGILMMDKIATTAGWLSVYNYNMNLKGDKAVSEKEAIRRARNSTLRTQPASHAKDVASLFTSETLSTFTMFSNQLNQIWNMATYDAPAALGKMNLKRGFTIYGSLALSAALIWMISNRDIPDEKDKFMDFMGSFTNYVPLLGPVIVQVSKGWDVQNPLYKIPSDLTKGSNYLSKGEYIKAAKKLLEGISFGAGLPYVEARRIGKGIESGELGTGIQYTLFGGKWFEE